MKQLCKLCIAVLFAVFIFSSCNDEDTPNAYSSFEGNAFIVNEGTFNNNTGGISMYDLETKEVFNDIFYDVNSRPLGDVVQSFSIFDGNEKAIIIVNNSQKAEIVDMKDFTSIATINGLSYPRYAVEGDEGELFVTNGNGYGGDKVYKIDYSSNAIVDSITVGLGPDRMYKKDGKIYVANSGSWSNDSTISVIDIASETVIATIEVEDHPIDFVEDANGMIWVFCKGNSKYDPVTYAVISQTNSQLVQIDPSSNTVSKTVDLGSQSACFGTNIMAISADGNTIYYENGGIWSYTISTNTVSGSPIIEGSFYGVNVNPETGNLWATVSSTTGNGKVLIYTASGVKTTEFKAGEYPSEVVYY